MHLSPLDEARAMHVEIRDVATFTVRYVLRSPRGHSARGRNFMFGGRPHLPSCPSPPQQPSPKAPPLPPTMCTDDPTCETLVTAQTHSLATQLAIGHLLRAVPSWWLSVRRRARGVVHRFRRWADVRLLARPFLPRGQRRHQHNSQDRPTPLLLPGSL